MIVNSKSQIIPVFIRDPSTGNGLSGVNAADLNGTADSFYSRGSENAVALAFSDGAATDTYLAGKWCPAGGTAGSYLWHVPDLVLAIEGITNAYIVSTSGIPLKVTFRLEKDWVRLAVSNKYTNTESNPGGNFDSVTVTNN